MTSAVLLSDGQAFVLSRALIHEVGLEEALVLQQVHYWLNPKRNQNFYQDRYWVHNTYKQWQKQFSFWSLKKIQRLFSVLEGQGFLLSFTQQTHCRKTKFYTLNYERLSAMNENPCVSSCPENGVTVTPKLSLGEVKNGCRRGQIWESEKVINEPENKDFCGGEPWDKNGMMVTPKVGASRDKIGTIDHPKSVLSYKLITETTVTDNPPPLTPPPSPKQEEEETSKTDRKEEDSLFQQMVDVWNKLVQSQLYPGSQALLTPQRATRMATFVQETAISDLASWERYCQQIRASRFLRGENGSGFRVTLDWALNPANARKILEGAIYDKPQASETPQQKFVEKPWAAYASILKQHCESNGYSDRWFEACKVLATVLGQATFENWFKEMIPHEQEGGPLHLTVKSGFFRDYIQTTYEKALKKAIQAAYPAQTCFEIRVGADPPTTALPATGVDQAGEDLTQ